MGHKASPEIHKASPEIHKASPETYKASSKTHKSSPVKLDTVHTQKFVKKDVPKVSRLHRRRKYPKRYDPDNPEYSSESSIEQDFFGPYDPGNMQYSSDTSLEDEIDNNSELDQDEKDFIDRCWKSGKT